jgi:endonuclease/exonuclease/phosphatase family metal-dependent hydrolase
MADKRGFKSWRFIKNFFGITSLVCLLFAYLSPVVHPETLWFIPFFGLAYPIIILAVLVYTIIAALKKSRWALITGALFLAGLNFHLRLFSFNNQESFSSEGTIRVMSYNVHLFDRYGEPFGASPTKRQEIIGFIHSNYPDVMCFQEFYHQDHPTQFPTRDTLINLFSGYSRHEKYVHKPTGRQNFGVVILSKFPMIEKGNVLFDESLNTDNYCIYADIVNGYDTTRIYNVHLQSVKLGAAHALFNEEDGESGNGLWNVFTKLRDAYPIRADQAKRIVEHIKNSPYPVIVCGDFNDTPMSYTYSQFSSYLEDAFLGSGSGLGSTYAGNLPAGRIDYFFHSEELKSTDFSIQEKALSDHYAIFCSFQRKNED